MSSLETIHLPHLPSSLEIHAALYKDVQNAASLRQQLLSVNTDFEYAFIDASMVTKYSLANALTLNRAYPGLDSFASARPLSRLSCRQ